MRKIDYYTPELRKIRSEALKKQWKDKEFSKRVSKGVSISNHKRKGETRNTNIFGINNPNYIDGRTKKWKQTRKKIFERDNYTCQICNKRGNIYLNCHHIIHHKLCDNIYDLKNLITLCKDCHRYISNIEFTDKYNDYKDKFLKIIRKED